MDRLSEALKNKRFISSLIKNGALKQFIRYIITGLSAAALEYLVFSLLYHYMETLYIPNSAGMTAGFILSFIMNRVWSFEARSNLFRQLTLYITLFCINLLISNYAIHLLSNVAGVMPALAKILVMGFIVLWNFVIYRKIIYKK